MQTTGDNEVPPPNEAEEALLAAVCEEELRTELLVKVLRSELHQPFDIYVSPDMHNKDQFNNFIIEDALKLDYVVAKLEHTRTSPPMFVLTCAEAPANSATYDGGDAIQDKLLQLFCLKLIRFEEEVCVASSKECSEPLCMTSDSHTSCMYAQPCSIAECCRKTKHPKKAHSAQMIGHVHHGMRMSVPRKVLMTTTRTAANRPLRTETSHSRTTFNRMTLRRTQVAHVVLFEVCLRPAYV